MLRSQVARCTSQLQRPSPDGRTQGVQGGVSKVSFSFRGNEPVREAIHTVFQLERAGAAFRDAWLAGPCGVRPRSLCAVLGSFAGACARLQWPGSRLQQSLSRATH